MKKRTLLVSLTLMATVAVADSTANKWQSTPTDGWNGAYGESVHWSLGHVPETGEFADFRLGKSVSASVTMPSGEYAAPASFRTGVGVGQALTLDFSEMTWTARPFPVSGTYYASWIDLNSGIRSITLKCGSSDAGVVERFSDVTLALSRPTETTGAIAFSGGSVNWYDPSGEARENSSLELFWNQEGMDATTVSFVGTDTRLPAVKLGGAAAEGRLLLGAGTHQVFGQLTMDGSDESKTNVLQIAEGATVAETGGMTLQGAVRNRIEVEGALTLGADVTIGSTVTGSAIDIVFGGTVSAFEKRQIVSSGTGAVNVRGGALAVTKGALSLNDGSRSGAMSLNLESGTVDLNDLYLYSGGAELNVSGGELTASAPIYCGFNNKGTSVPTIRMTGGTVVCGGVYLAHKNTGSSGCLILDGGVLKVGSYTIKKNLGTGTASLSADGGTVMPTANDIDIISGLDSAELGERGLTVDTNGKTTSLSQAFTSKAGVRGRLVKTGSGTLTLSAATCAPAVILVNEGSLAFAAGANAATELTVVGDASADLNGTTALTPLTGLTLGDESRSGVLAIAAGETVAVAGAVVMKRVGLSLSGAWTAGDVQTVLAATEAPTDETIAAWQRAEVVSGAADGLAYRFSVEQSDNAWLFKMTVAVAETVEVGQTAAGEMTDVSDRICGEQDVLEASAVRDGTLNLEGVNVFGRLVKKGEGVVRLTNDANSFPLGVELDSGTLFVSPLAALGLAGSESQLTLAGGTFEMDDMTASPAVGTFSVRAAAGAANAYVIKTDTDVELNLPTAASGALVKRGAGLLRYRATGTAGKLTTGNGCQENAKTQTPTTEIVFDANGTPPAYGFAGLNVAEGLLAVKGGGTDRTSVKLEHLVYVGLPVRGIAAQPALSIEDCTVTAATSGQSIELGGGATSDASDVIAPAFAMTNAVLDTLTIFRVGAGSTVALKPAISCSGSRFLVKNFYDNCASADSLMTCRFSDGTFVGADSVSLAAPVVMTFDASKLAKTDGSPVRLSLTDNHSRLDVLFRNGSEYVGSGSHRSSSGHIATRAVLRFDNGMWNPGAGEQTIAQEVGQTVFSKGAGLVFAPAEGDAWTVAQPIVCEAPIVLAGAGTVSFAGEASTGLVLTGTGTVANATLTGATLKVSPDDPEDLLMFADCTFADRTTVDLGRSADNPIPEPFVEIPIARYSGTAPAVGRWKLVGTGCEHVRGKFEAREGVVFVLPERTGLILYVR